MAKSRRDKGDGTGLDKQAVELPASPPSATAGRDGGDGAAAPETATTQNSRDSFAIVGLGASAGGLAALESFFSSLPEDGERTLAFVVIQHLDPSYESMLRSILAQHTRLPIHEAAQGARVETGNIYVIPSNRDLTIKSGVLQLHETARPRNLRLPIDIFFRSLAADQRERSVGIVLSGTGTDGTLGIKAIKEAGGLIMVQQPDSAQYDGMPRSAIATGLADFVSPPEEMPAQLIDFLRQVLPRDGAMSGLEPLQRTAMALQRIFVLLRSQTGHDFSRYKQNTILRRIDRRMAFHRMEQMESYARFLQHNPAEIDILFKELLIGVTNFFRDPEAFEALHEQVVPRVLANKEMGDTIRVWVPGCSTGEEAYSIAMLFQDSLGRLKNDVRLQIFATDIDAGAIEQARTGVYPNNIAVDVSPDRLTRFFTPEGNTYRIKKMIRDQIVFAEQNVVSDPPFSRLDLISCRNLMIYLSAELQKRVLPIFHYALNPNGYLFLGTSESVGEHSELFSLIDRKWKIYLRKSPMATPRSPVDFTRQILPDASSRPAHRDDRPGEKPELRQLVEQMLLAEHTPAVVVVNQNGDVVFIHGRTGQYLEPAPGEASLNILKMARDGLRLELTTALRRAVTQQHPVIESDLRVRANGSTHVINLTVRPLVENEAENRFYLVMFEEVAEERTKSRRSAKITASEKDERIEHLERELRGKEEYLQTTIEELETSNEELTSTNEELQSANEELHSTNEELETSKEELQSVNEELMTVNAELQKKIEELSRVNNDLNNVLAGTGVGTVFVDYHLRIQRFTPTVTDILNLIQTDVGRPVGHMVSNLLGYQALADDITSVLDTLVTKEAEFQLKDGRWYHMRIQPYRTSENVIEGAVITFMNITELKRLREEVARLRTRQGESSE